MSSYDTGYKKLSKSERKRIVKQLSESIVIVVNMALKEGRQVKLSVDTPVRDEVRDDYFGMVAPPIPTGEKTITLHISEHCKG